MADSEAAASKLSDSLTAERYRILLEISQAVIACQSGDEVIQVINAHSSFQ